MIAAALAAAAVSPLTACASEETWDRSRAQAACLEAKGWDIELNWDATLSIDDGPEAVPAFRSDAEQCWITTAPTTVPPTVPPSKSATPPS
ncbi:hypothetical protein GCM10025780_37040 [Frondihabitans cladoniiphilus]|uniref:Alpha amylase inhibitor n=1 Tax=Frondihabitans cladoniiphilus TaxID=715785 RepID=A0ABP8WDB5_9MICO